MTMAVATVNIWISPLLKEDAGSIAAVKKAAESYGETGGDRGLYLREVPYRPAMNVLDALVTRRLELEPIRSCRGLKNSYTQSIRRLSKHLFGKEVSMWNCFWIWLRDRYDEDDRHVAGLFRQLGIPSAEVKEKNS